MNWTGRGGSEEAAGRLARKINGDLARLHDEYRETVRALNEEGPWNKDRQGYRRRLRRMCDSASAFHEAVDNAVVQTDLLSVPHNELWAKDLASTAFNVLDALPNLYRRLDQDFQELGESPPLPSQNAFYAMECAVAAYHPDQVPGLLKRFKTLNLPIRGFTHPAQMKKYSKSEWNMILITGLGLILLMLAVAVFNQRFNNFNIWVFRVVTALAAALLAGAALPGLLDVKGKLGQMLIRTSGALAVLVLIFYVNPPGLVVNAIQTSDQQKSVSLPSPATDKPKP